MGCLSSCTAVSCNVWIVLCYFDIGYCLGASLSGLPLLGGSLIPFGWLFIFSGFAFGRPLGGPSRQLFAYYPVTCRPSWQGLLVGSFPTPPPRVSRIH